MPEFISLSNSFVSGFSHILNCRKWKSGGLVMALQRWQGNSHTGYNKVVCYRHAPSAKALVLCVQSQASKLPSLDWRQEQCCNGWGVSLVTGTSSRLQQTSTFCFSKHCQKCPACHPRLHICQASFWMIQSFSVVSFEVKSTLLVPLLPEDISYLFSGRQGLQVSHL